MRGVRGSVRPPQDTPGGGNRVEALTQAWVDEFHWHDEGQGWDWHMMQRVFVETWTPSASPVCAGPGMKEESMKIGIVNPTRGTAVTER